MEKERGRSLSTDIVVIGSGATGMAAALTAVDGGAKVILLEKMQHTGGTSNFPEGMFAVESEMQRQQYIGITRDEAFKMIMDYSHWRANPRLVRVFVDESSSTISWLQKLGVKFEGPMAIFPDGPRTWHLLKGPQKARSSVMMKTLAVRAKEKGIDIRLATPAKKLIKEYGKITGVIAEKNGKEIKLNAKAVIIGSGGYANNKEWIKKYTGFDLNVNLFPIMNVNKVGDGIRMAWEVGAAEEGTGVLMTMRIGPLLGPGLKTMGQLESAGFQPNLFVTQQGVRYFDEGRLTNFSFDGAAMSRLKEGYSYAIFDETAKREWVGRGIATSAGMICPPGTRLTDFEEEWKTALEHGNPNVFEADSIEELATSIRVNPGVLKATLDEYNGFCEKGHDDLFAKDPKYLRPLKGPKFYAMRCWRVFLSTIGGIKINHKMEVVDKEEKPIPGLYAGGMDVGGVYGDSYDVYATGGALGFAFNSGRIAAKNALIYMGKL
jgi:fumarate reductase flavoprotein subunit